MNTNMFKTILRAPGHHDQQVYYISSFHHVTLCGRFCSCTRAPERMCFQTPFLPYVYNHVYIM